MKGLRGLRGLNGVERLGMDRVDGIACDHLCVCMMYGVYDV